MYKQDNGRKPEALSYRREYDDGLSERHPSVPFDRPSVEVCRCWSRKGRRARTSKELSQDQAVTSVSLHDGMVLNICDFIPEREVRGVFDIQHSPIQFGGFVSGRIEFVSDRGCGSKGDVLSLPAPVEIVNKPDKVWGWANLPGGVRVLCVGVDVTEERLELILSGYPEYENLLRRFLGSRSGYNVFGQWGLSPGFRVLASQVLNCTLTGLNRRLFLECKALELIAMQLDRLVRGDGGSISMSPSDVERLHEARRILFERMEDPPGIRDLARLVGINEFKLKRGFREVFGVSVYEALRAHRMEVARSLLQDGDMTVGTVAATVGYTNMSHFIAMFRKQFGATPGTLIQMARRSYERS